MYPLVVKKEAAPIHDLHFEKVMDSVDVSASLGQVLKENLITVCTK